MHVYSVRSLLPEKSLLVKECGCERKRSKPKDQGMQPGKPKKTTAEKLGQAILENAQNDAYLGHGEEEKKDEEK